MKRRHVPKIRAPRAKRRMGTEVMEDSRLHRKDQREREELLDDLYETMRDLDAALDEEEER